MRRNRLRKSTKNVGECEGGFNQGYEEEGESRDGRMNGERTGKEGRTRERGGAVVKGECCAGNRMRRLKTEKP